MESKEFLRLNLIYVLYITGVYLGWNIIVLYFAKSGFSFVDITVYYLLYCVSSFLFIIYPRKFNMKLEIKISQALRIISFVLVMYFFSKVQLFLAAIVLGIAVEMFWIPYESKLKEFEDSDEKKMKIKNLIRLGSVLKSVVPFIGGLIAAKIGYFYLFMLSIFIFTLNIENTSVLGNKELMNSNIAKALTMVKKVKLILFLEGLWQTIPFIIIPLITLKYVTSEIGYGLFFSLIALLSVMSFHITKRLRDTDCKRYLYPLTTSLGIVTILAAFTDSFISWVFLTVLMVLTWKITERYTRALITKRTKEIPNLIILRRFFLSLGRIAGTAITIIVIIAFGQAYIQFSLIGIGGLFLLYPVALYVKK